MTPNIRLSSHLFIKLEASLYTGIFAKVLNREGVEDLLVLYFDADPDA